MGKLEHLYNSEVLGSPLLAFLHKGKSVFSQSDVQEALEAHDSGNAHYCALFSARMDIASGHLNDIFSLTQTKNRNGFLIKHSKVPATKLWFVDRRIKRINLVMNNWRMSHGHGACPP